MSCFLIPTMSLLPPWPFFHLQFSKPPSLLPGREASTKSFHTMDPFEDLFGCLSHSMTVRLGKYLDRIALIQSEFPTSSLHRFLPAKVLAKRRISFIPQPPNDFGVARVDHLVKCIPLEALLLFHKKLLLSFFYLIQNTFRDGNDRVSLNLNSF